MEHDSDDSRYQSHNEKLGGDLRNIVALCNDAPNGPYHAGRHRQKHQLMTQRKGRHLVLVPLKFFPILGIGFIRHRQRRILFDLLGVPHGKYDSHYGKHDPHGNPKPGAGHDRDSGNSLGHRKAEGILPGGAETDLGRHIGTHNADDRVIAHGDKHGHQDHHKGNRFLAHAENRSAQRKQGHQNWDQKNFLPLGQIDHPHDPAFHRPGAQDDPESAADHQDKGDDSYGCSVLISGRHALEHEV